MKFTNSSTKVLVAIVLSLSVAGCATKKERDVSLPSWVDIYDRYDEDGNKRKEPEEQAPSDDGEQIAPESSADATDRLASTDSEEPSEKEEEPKSLFDLFFGEERAQEPKQTAKTDEIEPSQPEKQEASVKEDTSEQIATAQKDPLPAEEQRSEKPTPKAEAAPEPEISTAPKEPLKPVEPPKPVIPKPKPLTAANEQHALEAQKASPEYKRALQKLKDGELQSAQILFQELSNRYPTLSGPIINRAIILRKQGNPKQAKALLQKAILNKTQNPYLMNELGLINRELGNFEAAKQSYLAAIRLEPNYDKAHYNLAVLADLYLHDPALAYQEFEAYQALQEEPSKKVAGWLKEIKRRMK